MAAHAAQKPQEAPEPFNKRGPLRFIGLLPKVSLKRNVGSMVLRKMQRLSLHGLCALRLARPCVVRQLGKRGPCIGLVPSRAQTLICCICKMPQPSSEAWLQRQCLFLKKAATLTAQARAGCCRQVFCFVVALPLTTAGEQNRGG